MCGRWKNQGRVGAFLRDRSGNVAMMWGLMGTVLLGLVGLTVDFTRAQSIRAQMQNAADGAALVAERSSNLPLGEREAAARAFFDAEMGPMSAGVIFHLSESPDGGNIVSASMPMPLTLARLVHNQDWSIGVESEAEASASPPIEVVLVLDNTYSMNGDIDDLRDAAHSLADFLLRIDGDSVSVALVPFEAYVNIGNDASHLAWMDTAGNAPFHGEILEDRLITRRSGNQSQCEGYSTAVSTGSPYQIRWEYKSSSGTPRCYGYNPSVINYFTLFDTVPNVDWKGCVEARPEPYDIDDTPPSTGNPATMFVPFFYIDDYDDQSGAQNDWINDSNLPSGTIQSGGRTFSVFKYDNSTPSLNEAPNTTSARGPNRGCPTPIVPLTTNQSTILNAIDNMQVWYGGGTNSAEGLAWGWRVLSPGEPFTQGRPYNDPDDPVRKVIVLMTDGENTNNNANSENSVLLSVNNAYGHRGLWANYSSELPAGHSRSIGSSSGSYVNYMNSREAQLCTNIKSQNIEIYTVAFRDPGSTIETLLRNCATDDGHYFDASNAQELQEAFDAIGSGIGDLRLTR